MLSIQPAIKQVHKEYPITELISNIN